MVYTDRSIKGEPLMARGPEHRVKHSVRKLLDATQYCYYFMPISGGFAAAGVPDFVGCHLGRFFAVETKAPGKKPTRLQEITMARITACGGKTFVVDGSDSSESEGFAALVKWIGA
jgi:hypothetical protein